MSWGSGRLPSWKRWRPLSEAAEAAPIHVWAPRAKRVRLVVAGGPEVLLAPDPDRPGWLSGAPALSHGCDYRLDVDGELIPDPLARWLPEGVNGPARHWEPASVKWSDHDWRGHSIRDASCIYEVHIGTFSRAGTLDAAIEHLDWLVELGVTHVELLPVAAFDGPRGWGYDGVALNAVHDPYGGPDALCRFVAACHERGLAVILDIVHNHLGPSGNHWARLGPVITNKYQTPWGGAINLDDVGSDAVREILLSSALGWIRDFHLDGLRMDAIHELIDNRALTYLEELGHAVGQMSSQLSRVIDVIGESDQNDPRTVTAVAHGGLGLTAQWDDDVHHALHWIFTGETIGYYQDFGGPAASAHALEHGFLHDGRWSNFRGRTHGRPIDFTRVDPWRFVVALQTHDQVGNRAQGDRLSHLTRIDQLAGAAAVLLSLPYTPMLFMGEEWGATTPWQFFTSFENSELGDAVTRGRDAEFVSHGWGEVAIDVPDPQDEATFEASKLVWAELAESPHHELANWYRDLLRLRREHAGFGSTDAQAGMSTAGAVHVQVITESASDSPEVIVLTKPGWATIVNSAAAPRAATLPSTGWIPELAWPDGSAITVEEPTSTSTQVHLEPGATAVLRDRPKPSTLR